MPIRECSSRIPDPIIFHPGSRNQIFSIPDLVRIKEFKYVTPKYCFKAFRNMIRVVHSGSGSWFFTILDPGSRGQKAPDSGSRIRISNSAVYPSWIPDPGVKRHRIPDPGSGSATLRFTHPGSRIQGSKGVGFRIPDPDQQHCGQHTLQRKKYTKRIRTINQKPTIVVGSQAKPRHEEDEPCCPLPSRHLCHVCAPSVSGPPFSFCQCHCGAISAICRHKSKAFLLCATLIVWYSALEKTFPYFLLLLLARGSFVFCSILLYLQGRLEKLWGSFMGFFTLTSVDGPGTIHLSALSPAVSLRSAFYLKKKC